MGYSPWGLRLDMTERLNNKKYLLGTYYLPGMLLSTLHA